MANQTFVPTDVGFTWERAEMVLAEAGSSTGVAHAVDTRSRIRREADEAAIALMAASRATRWRIPRRAQ